MLVIELTQDHFPGSWAWQEWSLLAIASYPRILVRSWAKRKSRGSEVDGVRAHIRAAAAEQEL